MERNKQFLHEEVVQVDTTLHMSHYYEEYYVSIESVDIFSDYEQDIYKLANEVSCLVIWERTEKGGWKIRKVEGVTEYIELGLRL